MTRKSTALKLEPVEPLSEPNPLIVVGSNNPPEPTPFELSDKAINDLYDEAKLWLDGAPVDNADMANGVTNLKNMILRARKAADENRDAEKRPFLEAGREVDARYKPLLTKADLAIDACKKANAPWLIKVQAEIDRKAAEARAEADRQREAAHAAIRASDHTNLAEREAAEELLTSAKRAEADAARAEKAKPLSGGAVGRRDGLVTVYAAELVDPVAAIKHYCKVNPRAVCEFLQGLADSHIRFGAHAEDELPGFKITSEQKVR